MSEKYCNRNDLPLVLSVKQVADILGVSYATANNVFHRQDFPSIVIVKRRRLVSRDKFFEWFDHQTDDKNSEYPAVG